MFPSLRRCSVLGDSYGTGVVVKEEVGGRVISGVIYPKSFLEL